MNLKCNKNESYIYKSLLEKPLEDLNLGTYIS